MSDTSGHEQINAYPDNNPKTKFGLTKPQMSLTPSTALVHLALAFADGAAKYGAYNWREKKVSSTVYVDAMLRHIADWFDGENVASDSGVHHLAHVMACCAIIIDAETVGNLNDNRPPKAPTAELIRAMTKGGLVSQADLDLLEARLKKKCQQVETARLTPAGPTVYGPKSYLTSTDELFRDKPVPMTAAEMNKAWTDRFLNEAAPGAQVEAATHRRKTVFPAASAEAEPCDCSCCQDARNGFHGGGSVDEVQWPQALETIEGSL